MSDFCSLIWRHTYRYLTLLVLILTCTTLQAHESSTAYLNLQPNDAQSSTYNAEYELSLRDLALLINIDANNDRQVSWAEVKSQSALIEQLINAQVTLSADTEACQPTDFAPLAINNRGGFNYLYTNFKLDCVAPISSLNYQVLAGIDANHRLILTQAEGGLAVQVLAVGTSALGTSEGAGTGLLSIATNFMKSGVHHLLIGWDHLLFLFVLLTTAFWGK